MEEAPSTPSIFNTPEPATPEPATPEPAKRKPAKRKLNLNLNNETNTNTNTNPSPKLPKLPRALRDPESGNENEYENGDKLIITDYNPDEVMEITDDEQNILININEVNNVVRVDKYFYYPSSFVCKFTSEGVFRTLGIHKFRHNKTQVLHTFSLSYIFHQYIIDILENQGFIDVQIDNINLRLRELRIRSKILVLDEILSN